MSIPIELGKRVCEALKLITWQQSKKDYGHFISLIKKKICRSFKI